MYAKYIWCGCCAEDLSYVVEDWRCRSVATNWRCRCVIEDMMCRCVVEDTMCRCVVEDKQKSMFWMTQRQKVKMIAN